MRRRTLLLGMGTAAAGGSALLGSGAFSEVSSQRAAEVEVVGDNDAYLGLMLFVPSVCDGVVDIAEITNQFTNGQTLTDIEAEIVDSPNDITVSVDSVPAELDIGETGTITVDVDCQGAADPKTVELRIEVNGDEERVTVNREAEIDCNC